LEQNQSKQLYQRLDNMDIQKRIEELKASQADWTRKFGEAQAQISIHIGAIGELERLLTEEKKNDTNPHSA
jgi:hypothetical protein